MYRVIAAIIACILFSTAYAAETLKVSQKRLWNEFQEEWEWNLIIQSANKKAVWINDVILNKGKCHYLGQIGSMTVLGFGETYTLRIANKCKVTDVSVMTNNGYVDFHFK